MLTLYSQNLITTKDIIYTLEHFALAYPPDNVKEYQSYIPVYEELCGKEIAMTVHKQMLQLAASYQIYRETYLETIDHLIKIVTRILLFTGAEN